MIPKTMKAVILTGPTRAEDVRLRDVPVPQVRPGWVLVRIRAFGLNHSEQILRLSEIQADYIQKPLIPGIECVGEVADPSDSSFHQGQRIVALMGWAAASTAAMPSMRCFRQVMYSPLRRNFPGQRWRQYRKPGSPPRIPCSSVYSFAGTTHCLYGAAPARWGMQPSAWQKHWAAGSSPPLTESGSCPC